MKKKNKTNQLGKEIEILESKRNKIIDREIQKIVSTNEEIIALNTKIDAYKKLLKKKEEQMKKLEEIDNEIDFVINQSMEE